MKFFIGLVAALASTLAIAGPLSTATTTIGDQSIMLLAPTGFVDASHRAPEIWQEALRFQATGTRLIEYYMTRSDYDRSLKRQEGDYDEYMMVQTPVKAEAVSVSQAVFDRLVSGTVKMQLDLKAQLGARMAAEVDRISRGDAAVTGNPKSLTFLDITPISVDVSSSNLLVYTVLTKFKIKQGTEASENMMVSTAAYCFVKHKVVMLMSYKRFNTPSDISTTRSRAIGWAQSFIRVN